MKFNEFYNNIYLPLHRKELTQVLHATGTIASAEVLLFGLILGQPWLLLIALVVPYLFAWPAHWFVEKNKPASWNNPIYSRLADWKMTYEFLTCKLESD